MQMHEISHANSKHTCILAHLKPRNFTTSCHNPYVLDLFAQGHKRDGESCLQIFSIVSEHLWDLFGMGVWTHIEITTIAE